MVVIKGEQNLEFGFPIGDTTRRYILDLGLEAQRVDQLFATPTPLLEGSVIEVVEDVVIELLITSRALIDADVNRATTEYRLGSYQIFNDVLGRSAVVGESDYGPLRFLQTSIQRTTNYVVVPPAVDEDLVLGISRTNACSFALIEVPTVPAQVPPRTEFLPVVNKDFLVSSHAIEFYPITIGQIRPKFGRLGLYIEPGVQAIEVLYRMRIGGQTQTSRPVFEKPGLCRGQETECDIKRRQYFEGGTLRFKNRAEIELYYIGLGLSPVGVANAVAEAVPITVSLSPDADGASCSVNTFSLGLSE